MLTFDLESNGLLPEVSTIHTISIHDDTTNRITRYDKQAVSEGLRILSEADCICGHNIVGYDIPAIKKVTKGQWSYHGDVVDTMIWSRLVCGGVKETDFNLFRKGVFPSAKLIGSHSLEAWGRRLGVLKGDYGKQENAWFNWSPEMSTYCEQDVKVTLRLFSYLDNLETSQEAFKMEHAVASIIQRQEQRGFKFNYQKAQELYEKLLLLQIEEREKLQEVIPPFYVPQTPYVDFIPKRNDKKKGFFAGAPMRKIKLVDFNPNSRHHIALVLHRLYKWEPMEWNEKEKSALLKFLCGWDSAPTVDDDILGSLSYEVAKPITKYMTITKRIGQIADGEGAWFKYYNKRTGAIHGAVNPLGAVTGRMTHFAPNLAQVPASYSPWGKECRELFEAREGYKLVGFDASGLEARILAHFLARYDGGAYVKTVTEGRKEDKTDVHNLTLKALNGACKSRDVAKTFLYAFLYGAGIGKIARILECSEAQAKKAVQTFLDNMPALKQLKNDLAKAIKERRGILKGIDGRNLHVRSSHSALNLICQSAGALVMKKALVMLDTQAQELGWKPGIDYEFVGNVHDECQVEVIDRMDDHGHWYPDIFGQEAVNAISDAGAFFKLRCPLDAEYKVGDNWKETH